MKHKEIIEKLLSIEEDVKNLSGGAPGRQVTDDDELRTYFTNYYYLLTIRHINEALGSIEQAQNKSEDGNEN